MIKSAIIYRIASGWACDPTALETEAHKQQFASCGATQEKSSGWVPSRGEEHGSLVESVGGQWIMRWCTETKLLPASVLADKLRERAAHIEQTQGRKPGKKESQELKDEIKLDLLPQAFTKQASVLVWINPLDRWLVLGTSSQAAADQVVTALVEAAHGFAVALVDTQTAPQAAMAYWLHSQEAPAGFSIDRECELKSAGESKAVVRYGHHPLDIAEIRAHIEAGKLPTRLALTWDDRVSFVLNDQLQLRKIELLDVVVEAATQDDAGFDADVAIFTGEMCRLIPDLLEALGGEGRTELKGLL